MISCINTNLISRSLLHALTVANARFLIVADVYQSVWSEARTVRSCNHPYRVSP